MNRAVSSTGRGVGMFAVGLLMTVICSNPAAAQFAGEGRTTPAASETPLTSAERVSREIERAEAFFLLGKKELVAGREFQAREAFDGALDIFLALEASLKADPKVQPAYQSLIDRILVAETEAGTDRRSVPARTLGSTPSESEAFPTPSAAPPATPASFAAAPSPIPKSTLAEMGERIETLKPTAEARVSNQAVLGTETIDLPIELNDQVLGAIDLYSGRFKTWFSRALSRGMPHLPRIREILGAAGIPQDLAYVPIVESAFNPAALSRAKAKGLWQFIPSTGKQYGLRQDFFVDERSNMEKATLAAAQYLKKLYALFGDWNLALAGYNAGEGNVRKAIRRAQTNDFWALAKTRSFRSETKNYVPLIHAAIVIAKSPGSYGIDLTPAESTAVATVRIAGSYPIATVARCANVLPADINQLNPDLRRGMTPSSIFDLKVPDGSEEQVSLCLAGERAMNYTRHVVRKRDTFSLLAKMFGVPAAEIARANGLSVKATLRPGTEMAIPRPTRRVGAAVATTKTGESTDTSYRIRKGDTLSAVAARHSTTVDAIKALNGLNSSRLSIGQVLRVTSASDEN
jgi:membrane-bound lytic murein transglycosylase D